MVTMLLYRVKSPDHTYGGHCDDVVNAAIGGQRTSDKSGGEVVTHFGDKCDDGLNAIRGVKDVVPFAMLLFVSSNYLVWM